MIFLYFARQNIHQIYTVRLYDIIRHYTTLYDIMNNFNFTRDTIVNTLCNMTLNVARGKVVTVVRDTVYDLLFVEKDIMSVTSITLITIITMITMLILLSLLLSLFFNCFKNKNNHTLSTRDTECQTNRVMMSSSSSSLSTSASTNTNFSFKKATVSIEIGNQQYPMFDIRIGEIHTDLEIRVITSLMHTCFTKYFRKNTFLHNQICEFYESLGYQAFNYLFIHQAPEQYSLRIGAKKSFFIADKIFCDDTDEAEIGILLSSLVTISNSK
jgi:hypothetical protein